MLGDYTHSRRLHPLSFQLLSLEDRWPVERLKVEKATFLAQRDAMISCICGVDAAYNCVLYKRRGSIEEERKWKDLAGKGLKEGQQSMSTMNKTDVLLIVCFYKNAIKLLIMFASCYRHDYQVSYTSVEKCLLHTIYNNVLFIIYNI